MIQKLMVGICAYLMLVSVLCQDFQFERVIECENNDFEIIEQHMELDPVVIHKAANPVAISNSKQLNEQLVPISGLLQAESQKQTQPLPKKTVRCKKWIQSYKMMAKSNLRTETKQQPQAIIQRIRKPLKGINKNMDGQYRKEQGQQKTENRSLQRLLTSYSNNNQQQAAQLMTLYFHYTMMGDIMVYSS